MTCTLHEQHSQRCSQGLVFLVITKHLTKDVRWNECARQRTFLHQPHYISCRHTNSAQHDIMNATVICCHNLGICANLTLQLLVTFSDTNLICANLTLQRLLNILRYESDRVTSPRSSLIPLGSKRVDCLLTSSARSCNITISNLIADERQFAG